MQSNALQPVRMRRTLVGIVQDIGRSTEVDHVFEDQHHGIIF